MKLNPDCVRDILLYLEENLQLSSDLEYLPVDMHSIASALPYSLPEVVNTLTLLEEADFLCAVKDCAYNKVVIFEALRLTYTGHQFLESVRPKTTWEKISDVCSKAGLFSLDFIKEVAVQIAANAIPLLL